MNLQDLNNINLNDLDFANMGSWPIAGKAVVASIVFALVVFVGYQMIISEQSDLLVSLERNEMELKKEFEKKQGKAVNLENYRDQMKTIQDTFKTLLQQLPKSSELAGLLEELSYAATGAGCEIIKADFQPEVALEFYSEKPIEIEVSGGYHQIANFISRVSKLSRIVTLHDFKMKLEGGDVPTSPGEKLLRMSVTARTYRSDSEG